MLGYRPDRTDRRLGMDQMKQTDVWVLARPKFGYGPDKRDRCLGIGQTNRPKIGYGPDETDQCLGIDQTEHAQFRYGPDRTDPKICPDYELGRTGPPVCDPGPSGPYLPWVVDFILGKLKIYSKQEQKTDKPMKKEVVENFTNFLPIIQIHAVRQISEGN